MPVIVLLYIFCWAAGYAGYKVTDLPFNFYDIILLIFYVSSLTLIVLLYQLIKGK
jgi:hypothetical protein